MTEEEKQVEEWVAAHFAQSTPPPFSFRYGDKRSAEFIGKWQFSQGTRQLDNLHTERIFTYRDLQTNFQVRCECILFKDFPAIEWVVRFRNNAQVDTPIIEDIQALNVVFAGQNKSNFILHHALGSSAKRNDFAPIDKLIKPNTRVDLAPIGGRSSNITALPLFNIEIPEEGGMMIGIGWSGQWAASFIGDDGASLCVRVGMERTHLKLYPNEEIRTPRILLLFWQGNDYLRGHNLFRRFILMHHTPKKDGKPVILPLACSSAMLHDEANNATEANQIDFASRFVQYGVQYHWIDAGWFEGRWPKGVGNWFVRKDGFPYGLRPVSDALKKMGMDFILWFEPERVYQGTWLDREYPEWVLRLPGNPNGLLNLGNREAHRWLTEHISSMLEREKISIYRQDFNMDPLPYWRAVDEPDRQGISEIRHIEGLYSFWDELLRRHPDLIIDNCASGGRRIDLETISRSICLWRTDYQYYEPTGYQSHTYGISFYLPCTSSGSNYPDVYSFRSSMNNGIVLAWNPYQPEFPKEQALRLIHEFKRVRHFFYGEFYPLTAYSIRDDTWIAYQFHREDMKQGMFLVFRRPQSPYLSARLKLRGLHPKADYELDFEDTGVKQIFTGEALCAGIDVTIENAPGSLLVTYRQLM